jgi:hypothetical protein
LRTIVTTAKVCYEDIHNNGQHRQAEKINHALLLPLERYYETRIYFKKRKC